MMPRLRSYLMAIFILGLACSEAYSQQYEARQKGLASYYADRFHGRITANGEIFNNYDLTAAHKSLPFGTYVNVVNEKNGKNVVVRINDRGPYARNRIIDLSKAAAQQIDLLQAGVVPVNIYTIDLLHDRNLLDSLFSMHQVLDCLGNESKLIGRTLSVWNSTDMVHALYYAADLYLKDDRDPVLVVKQGAAERERYHVVVTGFTEEDEVLKRQKQLYRSGHIRVVEFTDGISE